MDYISVHNCEPLLCVPEGNWAKISQQWFARLLRATDDMVHKHRVLLYLQRQQRQ